MCKNNLRLDILLFGFLLTFTSSFGQTFFISLFSAPIRESLSLSNFELSAVYSIATLLSAATLPWTGLAIDSMRLQNVTALSLLGLLIGAVAFSFAQTHIAILFIALFCLRQFGQGMLTLISATTMSRGFQGKRGRALSLSTLGHPIGEAIFPSIAVAALLTYGIQKSWLLIAVCLVALSTVIVFVAYRTTTTRKPDKVNVNNKKDRHKPWSRREVLRDGFFWMLLPMLTTVPFVITGLFFHQTVIAESKQWSAPLFAASFSVYAFTQVAGSLVTGALVDRWNARRLLRFTLFPLLFACMMLATSNTTVALWLFMGLAGLSTGAMFPSTMAALTEIYGVRNIGSIKSVVASAMVFSTAISPPIIGWFLDHNTNINSVVACLGIGVVISLAIGNLSLMLINQRQACQA